MNNKTILLLNSAFVSSEELWRWRRLLADNTLLDLHNSSDDTQPHSIIVLYQSVAFISNIA